MYKLLVVDVDGTLVMKDSTISPQNLAALRAARDAGVHVAICTGRSLRSSLSEIDEIGLDDFHSFYDGAFICHRRSEEIIHAGALAPEHVRELAACAAAENIYFEVSDGLRSFSSREHVLPDFKKWAFDADHTVAPLDDIWERGPFVQAQLITTSNDEERRVRAFAAGLDDGCQLIAAQIPPFPDMTFWVALSEGISKGTAVEKLAAHHGFSIAEVMAVGDWFNDVSMLTKAGLGVAMGQAPDEVKAVADYVTATVDDHGLAEAITKFVLS